MCMYECVCAHVHVCLYECVWVCTCVYLCVGRCAYVAEDVRLSDDNLWESVFSFHVWVLRIELSLGGGHC